MAENTAKSGNAREKKDPKLVRRKKVSLDEALSSARRWCLLEPLHEPARAAMIYLVAETGRPTAAREQYNHFANQLQAEIGERPSFSLAQALAGNPPLSHPSRRRTAACQSMVAPSQNRT
jgi:DNA-binding SARP family transcriptional activator